MHLVGILFVTNKPAYVIGLLTGGILAAGMSSHMYKSLQQAMLYDEETAAKKVQKGTILRYVFMLAGLVAALLLQLLMTVIMQKEEDMMDDCANFCYHNVIAKLKMIDTGE